MGRGFESLRAHFLLKEDDTGTIPKIMVGIAQLVSAPDCGSGGPGFKSLYPPFALQKAAIQIGTSVVPKKAVMRRSTS